MKKIFWIINQYASTPDTGMGGRHFYLAKELVAQGHTVYVIAAGFTHLLTCPPTLDKRFTIEEVDGIHFLWVKTPHYKQAHSKKRVLNWFLFSFYIKGLIDFISEKPDVIYYSSPSLVAFRGAKYLSNYYGSKFIFEIRDVWPLTLIELGGYSAKNPFIKFLQKIEDSAYEQSHKVLSNLSNVHEHMISRGMDIRKFLWVPNGFSKAEVEKPMALSEEVRNSIPKDKFIIGYAGTLGLANALDTLIESAFILRNYKEIVFLIVGQGKEKENLQKIVKNRGISNVIFLPPVKKLQVQSALAFFDVCYIGWKNDSLYKYGIAPNKLPEYLFSAKPIIHSFSGVGDVISDINAGITVAAEDPSAVAEAVLKIYNFDEAKRLDMGMKGRLYALENYEYSIIAKRLYNSIWAE
ncbi:glycosyltransferase WbuB [Pectobacterium carotovorum subsp. carotovorum]|nr:glycosyltransferase WbuB [Pectobacterium carotovorum subsp. carotovorum]